MVSWCDTNPPSLPDAGTVQVSVSSHGYGYKPIVLATVQRSFQPLLYGRGNFSTILSSLRCRSDQGRTGSRSLRLRIVPDLAPTSCLHS